jgi:hypothetical protein
MALRETDPPEVGGYRIEDRLESGGMGVGSPARPAPAAASRSRSYAGSTPTTTGSVPA